MRGGYRQNAGRKIGFAAKNSEEARRILSEMVMKEIRPIGEALILRAKNGEVPAVRELFDRAFGKCIPDYNMSLGEGRNSQGAGMKIYFDSTFRAK